MDQLLPESLPQHEIYPLDEGILGNLGQESITSKISKLVLNETEKFN